MSRDSSFKAVTKAVTEAAMIRIMQDLNSGFVQRPV
jgi:hypothetical protein